LPNTLASVAPTAQTAETQPRNVLLEITDSSSLELKIWCQVEESGQTVFQAVAPKAGCSLLTYGNPEWTGGLIKTVIICSPKRLDDEKFQSRNTPGECFLGPFTGVPDALHMAFVSVNCAAVPRELIAPELFGHEKGSFAGRRSGVYQSEETN
jgi:hypothetical protein